MISCPGCASTDLQLLDKLADGRKRIECEGCGNVWVHGQAVAAPTPAETFETLRRRFPGPDDVDPDVRARAEDLKTEFLTTVEVNPDERIAPYWDKYAGIFSREGLAHAEPQDLKDFANANTGANPGNMSVFNTAWNAMGAEAAAERVKASVDFLLHGPASTPLEDRLTILIEDGGGSGMPGFKEALLTKVLCIAHPDRFLTIVKYTGTAGKREIARSVYGLDLPDPNRVTWTIGRLILWSNDVLRQLVGEGFGSQAHAAAFLWWAKDRAVGETVPAP